MFIYSKKIIQFVDEIIRTVKTVLSKEIRLKVHGDRFYNRQGNASYPLKVVVYNNRSLLGYFDPDFYELGFHERLMHTSRETLHHIIRHELAHYMTFIQYGESAQPHGVEFRAFCQLMGWDTEVQKATFCLGSEQFSEVAEESSVLRKVQKLMALASSSNKNEAEQAMIKSQQLLLKHNIETKYLGDAEEERIVLKRILKQRKSSAKMRCISNILQTFFVSTVYSRAGEFIYLEILGNPTNVEIAEYVATILQDDLEKLWRQAQKQANLKGTIAKNSFFLGLAKGYCNKIQALKKEYSNDVNNALMVIEKQLVDAQSMVYKRLTSSRSSAGYCRESSAVGEQMGRQLNINTALRETSTASKALLIHSM